MLKYCIKTLATCLRLYGVTYVHAQIEEISSAVLHERDTVLLCGKWAKR